VVAVEGGGLVIERSTMRRVRSHVRSWKFESIRLAILKFIPVSSKIIYNLENIYIHSS